ncbi:MAG: hypothetical protein ACRBG0_28360 [Lewinella sp.]|uniref:hypothetical protein n=1 Tax=Lewinella sp. TaxID=2004506 RepID=UPI003D6C25A2
MGRDLNITKESLEYPVEGDHEHSQITGDLDVSGDLHVDGKITADGEIRSDTALYASLTSDTGMIDSGGSAIGLMAGGTVVQFTSLSESKLTAGQYKGQGGTSAAPLYSFNTDNNTGSYLSGVDTYGISAGGIASATFSPNTVNMTGGYSSNVTTITTSVGHIEAGDSNVVCTWNSGGPISIYLPGSAEVNDGYELRIQFDGDFGTVYSDGSDTINGTSFIDMKAGACIYLFLNGTVWEIVSNESDITSLDTRVTEIETKQTTRGQHLQSSDAVVTLTDDTYSSVILNYTGVDTHQFFFPPTSSVPQGWTLSVKTIGQDVELVRSSLETADRIERLDDFTAGFAANWTLFLRVGVTFMRDDGQWKVVSAFDYQRMISIFDSTRYTGTEVKHLLPVTFINGSDAAPSITFGSDLDTGMYRRDPNWIGFSTATVERFNIRNVCNESKVPFCIVDGSVGTPAINFSNDTNTGIYSVGADQLGVSAGGGLVTTFNNKYTQFNEGVAYDVRSSVSETFQLLLGDTNAVSTYAGGLTLNVYLPDASSTPDGYEVKVKIEGKAGTLRGALTTSDTIDGSATLAVAIGECVYLFLSGTDWKIISHS